MKGLTICEPWASAILFGHKRAENRKWSTNYRGPLAIHAGKSRKWLDAEDPDEWPNLYGTDFPDVKAMQFGAIIGTCELVACVELAAWRLGTPRFANDPTIRAAMESHFAEGPFVWVLKDVQFCAPLPYSGAMGLWDVPPSLAERLTRGRMAPL